MFKGEPYSFKYLTIGLPTYLYINRDIKTEQLPWMAPIKDPHPDHIYWKCAHVWDLGLKCHGKPSINYETCNFCEKDRIPGS